MRFTYSAVTKSGQRVEGAVEAEDRAAAVRQIESKGQTPITVGGEGELFLGVPETAGARPNKKLLKEYDGSKCPKCEVVYFGVVKKCQQCEGDTVPAKWYSRFCLERFAFVFAVALVAGVVALCYGSDGETVLTTVAWAGLITFSLYFTAEYFLGIGGFTEKFAADTLPPRANKLFSGGRFLSEIFRLLGVVIAMLVVTGIAAAIKWAFSGGD